MNYSYKIFLVLLLFLTSYSTSSAQDDIMKVKSRPLLVNDDAQLFTTAERLDLEQMLVAYNDSTSTQIAVITTNSLNGYAPGDYAARLGEQWGIGRKGKENGIVILIKPRIGNERGEVFIATGYGVEHILTDARVGRIIDNYMIPYLPNDYYRATKGAALVIIEMLSGEFQADLNDFSDSEALSTFLIAAIIFLIIIYTVSKRSNNNGNDSPNGRNSGSGRGPTYFPPMGRGFGRSSSGGRSGGGFGGFGGGSFGGGGAGRSF